jgi:hypothetical protein
MIINDRSMMICGIEIPRKKASRLMHLYRRLESMSHDALMGRHCTVAVMI